MEHQDTEKNNIEKAINTANTLKNSSDLAKLIASGSAASVNPVQLGIFIYQNRKILLKIILFIFSPILIAVIALTTLPSLVFGSWENNEIIEDVSTFQTGYDEIKAAINHSIITNVSFKKNEIDGDYQEYKDLYSSNSKVYDVSNGESYDESSIQDGDTIISLDRKITIREGNMTLDSSILVSYYTIWKESGGGSKYINKLFRRMGKVSIDEFTEKIKSCKNIMFSYESSPVSSTQHLTKNETFDTGEIDENGEPILEERTISYTLITIDIYYEVKFEGIETLAHELNLNDNEIRLAEEYARNVSLVVDNVMLDIDVNDINDTYDLSIFDEDTTELRTKIIAYAYEQLGKPYIYATQGPSSFDCSGYVYYILKHFNINISRTSSIIMADTAKNISREELRAGDLVFYSGKDGKINHVMMYIGNNKVIGACGGPKTDSRGNYIINGSVKIKQYNYRTPTAYATYIKESNSEGYKKGDVIGKFETFGYCSCDECINKWDISLSDNVKPNYSSAINSDKIKFEDRIIIDNGVYVADCTSNSMTNKQLGIYFSTHSDAIQYGNKIMTIYKASKNETVTGMNETTGNKTYSLSMQDLQFVYKVIAAESNGSYEGAMAVMSNVLNRVESSKYPNTIIKVLKQYYQYTGYYDPRTHIYNYKRANPANHTIQAVNDTLSGKRNLPNNVFYFLTHGCKMPEYATGFYATIGGNDYYY